MLVPVIGTIVVILGVAVVRLLGRAIRDINKWDRRSGGRHED